MSEQAAPATPETENHDEQPAQTLASVEPGVDKSLEFHKVAANGGAVRLTIVNKEGDKESIVVDVVALDGKINELGVRPGKLVNPGEVTPEGEPGPTNEGENLERSESSPELDPVAPGVEPDNAPEPTAGTDAPATTDPEGDTSKQNAPAGSGEADTATDPGTPAAGGTSQDETPVQTVPAKEAHELPLYVYVGEDPNYTFPAGYVSTSLQTPDGKKLVTFTDDVVGTPAKGAIDGTLGIYADEVVNPVTPA